MRITCEGREVGFENYALANADDFGLTILELFSHTPALQEDTAG